MRTLIITAILGVSLAGAAFADNTMMPAKPDKHAKKAAAASAMAPAKPMSAMAPAKPAATSAMAASTPKKAGHGGGVKAADRTPISKACSAQADTKGLHGKDRQKFRATCMKAG